MVVVAAAAEVYVTRVFTYLKLLLMFCVQSNQSCSGPEVGCNDFVVVTASNRKCRTHLLHVLCHIRNSWHSGNNAWYLH